MLPETPALATFQAQSDALTYEPYFGLKEKPFALNTDLRFLFEGPSLAISLRSLIRGIRRREGLIALTGEIGLGKTMLCRAAIRSLGRQAFSSFVPDPFGSREDLLKTLLLDFGAISIGDLTSGSLKGASRTELSYVLSGFLDSQVPSDAYAVVIMDEAQNLSVPMIEATRILCDSSGALGRLQIVFVGQLELHEKLKSPEMRQVDQRISSYTRLEPLSREAVGEYIQHRLLVAGGNSDRVLFPPAVVDVIHRRSGGVPRLVNRVCDRALHLAYERQGMVVDRECLDSALSSIGSATFTPTWASIVFADSPNGVEPVAAASPAPALASPATAASRRIAPLSAAAGAPMPLAVGDDSFLASIDAWEGEQLGAPRRDGPSGDAAEHPKTPEPTPQPAPQPAPQPSLVRVAPRRAPLIRAGALAERPAFAPLPERVWPKRLGIAATMLALLGAIALGAYESAALWGRFRTAPPSTETLATPAVPEAAVDPPVLTPPPQAPAPQAPPAVAAPSEYFVAVGLYVSSAFADGVVNMLTAANLPAMRRPIEVRGQALEQVVLGPFQTRDDATTDLQRLRQLGGYDDARVFEVTPPPSQ